MGIRGAGICLFNHRSLLLVHQRASKLWGFPKGSINESETIEECWRRELAEETGLCKLPRFNHSYTTFSHEYTVLVAQFLSPILPQVQANDEEILEAKWVPIGELFDLNLNALTRRVLFSHPLYQRYIRPKLSEETLRRLEGGETPEVETPECLESKDNVELPPFILPAANPQATSLAEFSLFAIPCERFPLGAVGIFRNDTPSPEVFNWTLSSPARCLYTPSPETNMRRVSTS
jgi:8-oxo-dGTP pyrophosphatase MutT (NUDIX family)